MSTCRISFTNKYYFIFIFFLLLSQGTFPFVNRLAFADQPITPFLIKGVMGSVMTPTEISSTALFLEKRVVFVVIGRCSGFESFLAFQKRLSSERGASPARANQTLILCVSGEPKEPNPAVFTTSDQAMKALGLTGTPMILGIENNTVKWRLAGLIPHWQSLAIQYLESPSEDDRP
ncbi:MAG: hypothetical protein AAB035_04390 [Nitrospirota bacterium]